MKNKKLFSYFAIAVCLTMFSGKFSVSHAYDIYSQENIKKRIVKEAVNCGVDPELALSLVKQESAFDRTAKSSVGAIGLFQLMPQTAQNLGVNPYYINQNIKGGISYLKSMQDQFGSDELALAAYNAGPGAVSRYGGVPPYRETRHYVKTIMKSYKDYQEYPDPLIVQTTEENQDRKSIAENLISFFAPILNLF